MRISDWSSDVCSSDLAIICTHTHRDHSPASRPLQQATGAPILGCAPLVLDDDGPRADASFDSDYAPNAVLSEGEAVQGEGWRLETVATPGQDRKSTRLNSSN